MGVHVEDPTVAQGPKRPVCPSLKDEAIVRPHIRAARIAKTELKWHVVPGRRSLSAEIMKRRSARFDDLQKAVQPANSTIWKFKDAVRRAANGQNPGYQSDEDWFVLRVVRNIEEDSLRVDDRGPSPHDFRRSMS